MQDKSKKAEETKETKSGKDSGTLKSYSIYPIRVTVFNSDDKKKGRSVKISKQYRNNEGEYKSTDNFNLTDLATVRELLRLVIDDQTEANSAEYGK